MPLKVSAADALDRLKDGNRRFAADMLNTGSHTSEARRQQLLEGQEPYAIILGCADSRVPAEIVFDQGLGDLFVIRIAGNIVAPSQIGSIEFAAEMFGTRLVVVLGHSMCGAVYAALDELEHPEREAQGLDHIYSIVDRIKPSVKHLLDHECDDHDEKVDMAVKANIYATVNELKTASPTLKRLMEEDGLMIVGAEYNLESGEVAFFD